MSCEQFIQKKSESYESFKDDTVWSMDKFNRYMNDNVIAEKGLEVDWVLHGLKVSPSLFI